MDGEPIRPRESALHGVAYGLAGVKLLLHLMTTSRYGIFRDELYYLATAEHLDWGYVDQPPMIALHVVLDSRLWQLAAGASIPSGSGRSRTGAVDGLARPGTRRRRCSASARGAGRGDGADLPAERAATAIFANNYGQAGAIDFFGPKYGLPKAISNHQNYWLWGPREYRGETVIVPGSDGSGDRQLFRSAEAAARAAHPFSRLDERYDIWLCRGLNQDLRRLWPQIKKLN